MRSYLESCKKNGIHIADAIDMAIKGEVPEFILKVLEGEPDNPNYKKAA